MKLQILADIRTHLEKEGAPEIVLDSDQKLSEEDYFGLCVAPVAPPRARLPARPACGFAPSRLTHSLARGAAWREGMHVFVTPRVFRPACLSCVRRSVAGTPAWTRTCCRFAGRVLH